MSAAIAREWHRFTPTERLWRFAVYLCGVAAIVASIQTVEVIPEFIADAPEQIGDMLRRSVLDDELAVAWPEVSQALHAWQDETGTGVPGEDAFAALARDMPRFPGTKGDFVCT